MPYQVIGFSQIREIVEPCNLAGSKAGKDRIAIYGIPSVGLQVLDYLRKHVSFSSFKLRW